MRELTIESKDVALSESIVRQSSKKEWAAPRLARLELSETENGAGDLPLGEDVYANGLPVS